MSRRASAAISEHWSLAVFSSRDSASRLTDVVTAAANADRGNATLAIDVVVNGNRALASELRARLSAGHWWKGTTTVRLWSLPDADKAHAWNQYLHTLMPETDLAFFLDGCVRIDQDALLRVAEELRRSHALAATSVPRGVPLEQSLRRLYLEEGGLHGHFFAFTGPTARRFRRNGIRLPRGITRNDQALGAALAFDLDPAHRQWSWDRIAVVEDAGYDAPDSPARTHGWKTVAHRRLRRARGELETRALKAHLADARRSPAHWPPTARELILQWACERRSDARALAWTDPLAWFTLQQLRRRRHQESGSNGRAECLGQFSRAVPASAEGAMSVSAR